MYSVTSVRIPHSQKVSFPTEHLFFSKRFTKWIVVVAFQSYSSVVQLISFYCAQSTDTNMFNPMMNRCIAVLLFLVSSLSFATSRQNNGWNHRPALVARSVPRGGGLFNNNSNKKEEEEEEEASKAVR
jgi:hypothetical protein